MSSDPSTSAVTAPRTARERARLELTREITDVARRQLAEVGAAHLSLRAVARELGMVSSAVYRYVASRDELLTLLIIDAYEAIGAAAEVEHAAAVRRGDDHLERWRSVTCAVRAWALEHPQEWALVYGSPVTGYAAPPETVEPAGRLAAVLARIAVDARADGRTADTWGDATLAPAEGRSTGLLELDVRALLDDPEPSGFAERALLMWITMVGAVNFELFGHLRNVVVDTDAYFDSSMRSAAALIGLTPPPGGD